jgi:diketogulonate reductase-like aldo/keto reductase
MTKSPSITLNNGVEMPQLGLGVYLTPGDQTTAAVSSAIASGYRLVDTAAAYGNEQQVGEGIRRSDVARADLFVTTKLWIADFGYEAALRAFDVSLGKLAMDYADLYLLHWPAPSSFEKTIAAYKAAEKLLADGKVRAIGVSNFNPDHLDRLMAEANVVPAVNQIELHPTFNQDNVTAANARLGIITQCWSPIGGIYSNHPADPNNIIRLLDHPVLVELAAKAGKTPAQLVLRWHVQHGRSVIPKSTNAERIAQNIDVFDFELDESDMRAIDDLDTGARGGSDPNVFDMAFLAERAKKREASR